MTSNHTGQKRQSRDLNVTAIELQSLGSLHLAMLSLGALTCSNNGQELNEKLTFPQLFRNYFTNLRKDALGKKEEVYGG